MGREIYHSPVSLRSREEVRNGGGNISLFCQLKKGRGSQEWEGKYISLLSVKEAEKSGMGEEIYLSPVS
jgi:hypothetical protein